MFTFLPSSSPHPPAHPPPPRPPSEADYLGASGPALWRALAARLRPAAGGALLPAGAAVCGPGDACDRLLVVEEGELLVFPTGPAGPPPDPSSDLRAEAGGAAPASEAAGGGGGGAEGPGEAAMRLGVGDCFGEMALVLSGKQVPPRL